MLQLAIATRASAVTAEGPEDFSRLSLEELMNIEVTSVSKRPERASDAAAAIHVITEDDIRRSGATSIPDLLRTVPGLQVAQIDGNKWAITARGFNSRFANKLLVLIDGRSIYTPLFSGVLWDQQEPILQDIERIEVIRGPGATLWGANAVNGVINIITRHSRDTLGTFMTASLGNNERILAGRYGAKLGENSFYRSYAKGTKRDGGENEDGSEGFDGWHAYHAGFRSDIARNNNAFTVQGDMFANNTRSDFNKDLLSAPFTEVVREDAESHGGNLLGHWNHTKPDGSEISLKGYIDYSRFTSVSLSENRLTADIEAQHVFSPFDSHTMVWGAGYRITGDKISNTTNNTFDPEKETDQVFSAFIQDKIELVPDTLDVTVGSKFEINDYTGFEWQPSVRTSWRPTATDTLWAAVSRAVRTPTRAENDLRISAAVIPPLSAGNPAAVPLQLLILGSDDVKSEEVMAYELGYRTQPKPSLSLDAAAFYNVYHSLSTIRPGSAVFIGGAQPHLELPLTVDDSSSGETYGIELAADWRVQNWWRLRGSYSFFDIKIHIDPGNPVTGGEAAEGQSPHHSAVLQSSMAVNESVSFDTTLRYVDSLSALGVPDYLELDARLAWRPAPGMELAITGRNLLHDRHQEFGEESLTINPTSVPRTALVTFTVEF